MKWNAMPALLALLALTNPAAAQELGCPDQRATNLDGRTAESGPSTRCGVGLIVFGIQISIFGPRCPGGIFVYPAHAECLGDKLVGSDCEKDKDIPVQFKSCSCQSLDLAGFGFASPNCVCSALAPMGMLESFKTVNCPPMLRRSGIGRPKP